MSQSHDARIVAIAQGIVMGARDLAPEDAGMVLLGRADAQGRSLIEVAAEIVTGRQGPHDR